MTGCSLSRRHLTGADIISAVDWILCISKIYLENVAMTFVVDWALNITHLSTLTFSQHVASILMAADSTALCKNVDCFNFVSVTLKVCNALLSLRKRVYINPRQLLA